MPLGRRNGLQVSPLSGLSYGNQDLFGPVSINDKYDVNWGFLNKLGDMMNTASKKVKINIFQSALTFFKVKSGC